VRRGILLCVTWLGAVAAVTFVSLSLASGAAARQASCGPLPPPRQATELPPAAKNLVLEAAEDNAAFRLPFGQSRLLDARRVRLKAFDAELENTRGLDVRLGSGYLHGKDGRTINLNDGDGLYSTLSVVDPHTLELCVEVRPNEITQFHAGRYTGMIAVVAGKKQSALAAMPVELTFRAPLRSGLLIAIVGVLLRLLVKVLSEAAAGQQAREPRAWPALKTYISQLTFPAIVIVACMAGWLVFSQTYSSDPVWGANGADTAKLLGACFIAQLGSVEGINLAKRIGGGPPGSV
jgi:hypothetical protein